MSKSKCQKTLEGLRYAEACVLYYERISKLPDCNNCSKQYRCQHCPEPGETVRINCFAWEKKVRKNSNSDNEKDGV